MLALALNAEYPGLLPRGDYPEVAERIRFFLRFHNVEDTEEPSREPRLVNMRTGFGHVDLIVTVDSHVVHRAHYTVSRLLGAPLAPSCAVWNPTSMSGGSPSATPRSASRRTPGPRPWWRRRWTASTTGTGLSTTDVDLRFATFRRPGQVAGLINVPNAGRTVRFYGRLGDRMVESAVWSPDEHGRYSLRRPAPDDR